METKSVVILTVFGAFQACITDGRKPEKPRQWIEPKTSSNASQPQRPASSHTSTDSIPPLQTISSQITELRSV